MTAGRTADAMASAVSGKHSPNPLARKPLNEQTAGNLAVSAAEMAALTGGDDCLQAMLDNMLYNSVLRHIPPQGAC